MTLKAITNNIIKLIIEHTNTLPWLSLKDQDQFNIIPQSHYSQASGKRPKLVNTLVNPNPKHRQHTYNNVGFIVWFDFENTWLS